MSDPPRRLRVFPDAGTLARAAASWTLERLAESFALRGRAAVALSGGNSPVPLLEALATSPLAEWAHWPELECYWVDERAVGPEDPGSNYGLARRHLLYRLPVPPRRVHRMRGEVHDLDAEARRYAGLLAPWREAGVPRLDVLLLGVGTDGHVASLFPGSPLLDETHAWVSVAEAPPPYPRRLTVTPPVLDAARNAAFVVTGPSKREVLRALFAPHPEASRLGGLPAARLRRRAHTEWFADAEAAAESAGG